MDLEAETVQDEWLRYSYNTCEVTNCSNNQFTTVSLWVFLYVRVKHVKVSAVKNKYDIKIMQLLGDEWLGLRVLKEMNVEKYDTELYEL